MGKLEKYEYLVELIKDLFDSPNLLRKTEPLIC